MNLHCLGIPLWIQIPLLNSVLDIDKVNLSFLKSIIALH